MVKDKKAARSQLDILDGRDLHINVAAINLFAKLLNSLLDYFARILMMASNKFLVKLVVTPYYAYLRLFSLPSFLSLGFN